MMWTYLTSYSIEPSQTKKNAIICLNTLAITFKAMKHLFMGSHTHVIFSVVTCVHQALEYITESLYSDISLSWKRNLSLLMNLHPVKLRSPGKNLSL